MQILKEQGKLSEIAAEIAEYNDFDTEHAALGRIPPRYRGLGTPPSGSRPDMLKVFKTYVNNSRGPLAIRPDGMVDGSETAFRNYVKSFKKHYPECQITTQWRQPEGESSQALFVIDVRSK